MTILMDQVPMDKKLHWLILRKFDATAHLLWYGTGSRDCVDAGDVLTLPFYGTWKDVAPYYKTLREDFQANIK
jgi:hypothetical protein